MEQKVAIISDVRGWAFDGIAQAIKRYNRDPSIEIDLFYEREITDPRRELLGYDLLWPFSLFQAYYCQRHGLNDYITTVHMHPLGSAPGKINTTYNSVLQEAGRKAKRVSAINQSLFGIWRRINPETYRVIVGVDPYLFYPDPAKVKDHDDLWIGWVGNWDKPYKRFDLVQKATDVPGIKLVPLNWDAKKTGVLLPHDKMGRWYRKLDVLLFLSDHEGLPTPMLEAAACGIPMVTTSVGVAEELIVDGENGFIVDQDVAAVQEVLISLRDRSSDECRRMAKATCEAIKPWMWPNVIDGWIKFIKGERM